ncbi:MAG TPA: thiamine pyrophosphate-dependent enzyme, partial [Gammaproteobacteria bacterium]
MHKIDYEDQGLFHSGHAACPGCQESLALRTILNALGDNAVAVFPPSCGAVICGPHPYSSLTIPVFQTTLESAAASASGLKRALNQRGKSDATVVCFAGDGGTYDIGFQALSSAVERNEDILYVCFDNEGYMNTGAQKSSSTPLHASTASTPAGKQSKKKNMVEILAAHGIPYVATAATGYLHDLIAKVHKAKTIQGTRFLVVLVPCLDGWGLPDDAGVAVSRLAVESGVWPLYEVEDGTRYTLNKAS